MHELLKHVLNERDLTRAGDIFAIPDSEIVDDLNEVLKQITEISSRPDYSRNDRDQALIEICVTRVTSCIKETGTLEKYCGALVALLESCLHHNLMPLGHLRDDDPPHAKIASDIIACIVLVSFPLQSDKENYGNKAVMELFLPVAVQFLHKGNREISRHMARYLSLAAIHHAVLLKPHVQTIMDSIMSGNYPLCRILTNLYEVSPEPLESHASALVSLLPHAEQVEKNSLFALLDQMAVRKPEALKNCVPQLLSYLCPNTASQNDPGCMCLDILQVVSGVSRRRPSVVREASAALRRVSAHHATPATQVLVADILTHYGYTGKASLLPDAIFYCGWHVLPPRYKHINIRKLILIGIAQAQKPLVMKSFKMVELTYATFLSDAAQEALNFILERLGSAERGAQASLLRDATSLCSAYPALFTDKLLTAVRANAANRPKSGISQSEVNRTSSGVTIVKLGGGQPPPPAPVPVAVPPTPAPPPATGYTRRAKLGDSRSTGRLHPPPNSHRSCTRLHVPGGSVGGLHKSMTRLSSSQQINNSQQNTNGTTAIAATNGKQSTSGATSGVTVTSVGRQGRTTKSNHHNILILPSNTQTSTSTVTSGAVTSTTVISSTGGVSVGALSAGKSATDKSADSVTTRRNNTSVTVIGGADASQRISVFEPYPMRDTVQHFCEKHLDKIKAYMAAVSLRLPPPAKCTIEERRNKKAARLQFACGRRGPHCLYAGAAFCVRTRLPRTWIHLMFLALQARHGAALSSRDATVASLRHCWDILKCENRTFLTLVTSAFPGLKEQEMVVDELRAAGFFDVFEVVCEGGGGEGEGEARATWGCLLCTHPERARGFLSAHQPVIEGTLKEKKGRWRLFRRWRTRYFTLSAAHLSCKGSSGGESIDINQIRSVKVSRGARNIPKAFEIFTGDQTLILKPKDGKNAEEWVQCLSIAVAHSHAKDAPAKANSLPARGLTLKSF